MAVFKASADLNVEGQGQIISRDPGIYLVTLDEVKAGVKKGFNDAPDVPTLNITLKVQKVLYLYDKEANRDVIGKNHTDVIQLKAEDQKQFDNKVKRIAHILTKAGVDKDAILKIELKSNDMKGWTDYANAVSALVTDAHKKTAFNFKVVGSLTQQGTPYLGAPGYLGFATPKEEEQKFSTGELKSTADYYAALNNATPSAEGGAPVAGGAAF